MTQYQRDLEAKRASGQSWSQYYATKKRNGNHQPIGSETRAEPGVDKKTTQSRQLVTFPNRFVPRFWEDSDMRIAVVKTIKRRYRLLKEHCGGDDSAQRDALTQRLAFLLCVLETKEVECAEGKGLDLGSYVQSVNSVVGLIRILGLEKHVKSCGGNLATYLNQKRNGP